MARHVQPRHVRQRALVALQEQPDLGVDVGECVREALVLEAATDDVLLVLAKQRFADAAELLHLVGEAAAGECVARPEPSILDEEPVIDSARGRGEGLVVLARDVRAEGPRLRQPASWVTRQITWPVVTA